MRNRIISVLLSFMLLICMLPATTIEAVEAEAGTYILTLTPSTTVINQGSGSADIVYTIMLTPPKDSSIGSFQVYLKAPTGASLATERGAKGAEGKYWINNTELKYSENEDDGSYEKGYFTTISYTVNTGYLSLYGSYDQYPMNKEVVLMTISMRIDDISQIKEYTLITENVVGYKNSGIPFNSKINCIPVNVQGATINVDSVALNKSNLTLTEGASETLTATVTPDNATDKTVTWASSAPTVASVDSSGNVTAVAEGTATITVTTTDGGKTATCAVTVKKAACTHANKTEHPAVASTCIALGNNKYYTCNDCGQAFKADGTTETTVEAEKLTTYGEHVEGTPATCTAKAKCSVCGQAYGELAEHVFTEEIEDATHLASAGDCQTNKTYYYDCANCDLIGSETFESTSKGEHKLSTAWTTENNKHYHECTVTGCGYVADEADCSGGTATCTKKAVCSVCNKEYGELAAHEYKTEWNQGDANGHWHDCENCSAHDTQTAHTPGAEATEDTPQVCTECGYIIVPATGHITHTADTSTWLYDANKHWHKCVGCDKKMDEAAHIGGTATCTAQAKCSVCGQAYGELAEHVFTEEIEDAAHLALAGDCQTNKTYYYDCANCALIGSETFESTSKGEHKLSTAWTTENNKHYHECTVTGCGYVADEAACSGGTATCTKKAVCSVCNKEYGELAAHEYKTEWNQGDANGHWHDCENCSAHDTQTAHIPGAEATEDTPQVCTECGYIIVPATGHITHTADTSKWLYNANKHWHKCVGCDEKMDEAAHTGGTATCTAKAECEVCGQAYGKLVDHVDTDGDDKCDVCGGDMHVHSYSSKWSKDSKYHWHECECGAVDSKSAHKAGGWIIDTYPTAVSEGSRHRECTVCGYIMADEDIPPVQESGFERERWAVIMSQLRNRKPTAPVEPDKSEKDEPVIESPEIIDEKLDVLPEEIVNEWVNPFIDIFETDSYYKAIEFVYENGLFKGVSATEFAPDTTMTRAMFVTVLGRLAGIDVSEYNSVDFDDVVPGEWYAPYVAWAAGNGIVKGYGNGLFGINDEITVEQATTIIARYAVFTGIDTTSEYSLDGYTDSEAVSDWAKEAMAWTVEKAIYDADAELNPQNKASRALVAVMLYNFAKEL